MRRRTRFGLAALLILLVLSGIYSVGWLIFAGRLKDGFAEWAQSARTGKVEISWQKIEVRGFPAAFRIDLGDATFVDRAMDPAPELHIAALSGNRPRLRRAAPAAMPQMRRGGADPHRGLRSVHQLRLFEMLVVCFTTGAIV